VDKREDMSGFALASGLGDRFSLEYSASQFAQTLLLVTDESGKRRAFLKCLHKYRPEQGRNGIMSDHVSASAQANQLSASAARRRA